MFADRLSYQLKQKLNFKGLPDLSIFEEQVALGGAINDKISEMISACTRDIDQQFLFDEPKSNHTRLLRTQTIRSNKLASPRFSRDLSEVIDEASDDDDDELKTEFNDSEVEEEAAAAIEVEDVEAG